MMAHRDFAGFGSSRAGSSSSPQDLWDVEFGVLASQEGAKLERTGSSEFGRLGGSEEASTGDTELAAKLPCLALNLWVLPPLVRW